MSSDADAKRKDVQERATKLLALDYFSLLGVGKGASADDVVRAFTLAAKTWHPDRVPAGLEDLAPIYMQVFARLDEARATLSDASRRLRYAGELGKGGGATTGPSASSGSTASKNEAMMELKKSEIMTKKHDLAAAEKHLRRAVQLDPASVELQAQLVWFVAQKPDLDKDRLRELVAELGRLIQKDESCEHAYFFRAQLEKRLELHAEAARDFARAADLNPQNVEAAREVRLHTMRKEKKSAAATEESGIGGFFKKLIKR